jgi:hypothetical protein
MLSRKQLKKHSTSSEELARGCSGGKPALAISCLLHSRLSMLVVNAIRVSLVKPHTRETGLSWVHTGCLGFDVT